MLTMYIMLHMPALLNLLLLFLKETTVEHTFFSIPQDIVTKMEYMLGHKTNVHKLKKIEII